MSLFGCRDLYIVKFFLIVLSIFFNSSTFQLIVPAPYLHSATVIIIIDIIIIIFIIIIIIIIIIIFIKTYIWDSLITKWFFSLQLKGKNLNAINIGYKITSCEVTMASLYTLDVMASL